MFGIREKATQGHRCARELGKVRDLPPLLRNKLPADADPEGEVYWAGEEPLLELRIREAEYEQRAQEAQQILAGAAGSVA